jgi:hypothetical protein
LLTPLGIIFLMGSGSDADTMLYSGLYHSASLRTDWGGGIEKKGDWWNRFLKLTVSRDFLLQIFTWIILPQPPENNTRVTSNLFENSRRYSQVRVHRQKFEMTLLLFSWAGGKLIHGENLKSKISWHCPFKSNFRTLTSKLTFNWEEPVRLQKERSACTLPSPSSNWRIIRWPDVRMRSLCLHKLYITHNLLTKKPHPNSYHHHSFHF